MSASFRHPRLLLALALLMATPATRAADVTTFDELLRLVRSEPDPTAVLKQCGATIFTLSKDQHTQLGKAGATPALIDALQTKRMELEDVRNFALILDSSGSMQESLPDGRSKMDAAKAVLTDLVKRIPDGMSVSLTVYGHDAALKCQAVEVKWPLGQINPAAKEELTRIIAALQPAGATPIAAALRAAGGTLAEAQGLSQVVLVTDGMETCHGDPAAVAEALTLRHRLRRVEVVGLGIKEEEKGAVTRIARRGRGKFYDAQTAQQLAPALREVVKVVPNLEPKDAETEDLPPRVKVLVEGLQDEDTSVRASAAEGLGKMGAKAKGAVPALVKRVVDERWNGGSSPRDKNAALWALKALAPEKVEQALIDATKAKNPSVKEWANEMLGELDDTKP